MIPAPASIGLISNRNSGHNRDHLQDISAMVRHCPNIHHVGTDCVADIPDALAKLASRKIEALAINGGDGTVSAILGQILEGNSFASLPKVLLLPGGTANMTAGDIGVQGKLTSATRRLCQWASGEYSQRRSTVRQRVLLRVQIGENASPAYGMFLGAGAVMQGTEYAHREIHARGLRDDFSVAISTIRTIWGLVRKDPRFVRPVPISLELDNSPTASVHNTLILAVSSLERLFFGMQPFWGEGPGPLRLTLIEQPSHRFLRTFISIARGRPNRHAIPQNGYFSHNAHTIRLDMQGSLNLDGEILHADPESGPVLISASAPISFLRL